MMMTNAESGLQVRGYRSLIGQVGFLAVCVNLLLVISTIVIPSHALARSEGPIRIVALGDSLVAGFGLKRAETFSVQIEQLLRARGHNVEIVNAGVSGDTTAAGLRRLDWAIGDDADAVIIELGANDALRGLDPAAAKKNLDEILKKLKARALPVLIAGMRAPVNLGEDYRRRFDRIFADLAEAYSVLLYPFFLDGVALRPGLNLADGIHPNAKGQAIIARRMVPVVEKLIEQVKNKRLTATTQ